MHDRGFLMCMKTVFNPVGPCCGGVNGLCHYFPSVDWSKSTWLVRMPRTRFAEERHAGYLYGTFRGTIVPETFRGDEFSYVGSAPKYAPGPPGPNDEIFPEVFGATTAFHVHGGEYIASHAGGCDWDVNCRERLCPGTFALATAYNQNSAVTYWYLAANHIFGMAGIPEFNDWEAFAFFTGRDFYSYVGFANPGYYVSWRRVLKAYECEWKPTWTAEGWELTPDLATSIDGGLYARAALADSTVRNPSFLGYGFYKPRAMDLAVSWTLFPGLKFGVVNDARSPLHGQFVISQGGDFAFESTENGVESWIVSTPWRLESGETVAEYGAINKFVRTDDNDTLPAWVELELIRI